MSDKQQELVIPTSDVQLAKTDPQTPMQILAAAVQSGADPDKLGKMMDLCERSEDRKALKEFNGDLAKMQQELPILRKNATGVHGAKFTSFDYVVATVRPILSKFGFSFTFYEVDAPEGQHTSVCRLKHRAGHSEETPKTVHIDKSARMNDTQKDGSAQSYANRYALLAALGIACTGEDDDGGAAGSQFISEGELADLEALLSEVNADVPRFLKWLKVEQLAHCPKKRYKEAVRALEAKRR